MIFRENYVKKIMAFTDTPFVKVLTGVRRCGKSTIMQMIMDELRAKGIPEERIVSYRFDSMEYEGMTAKQLSPRGGMLLCEDKGERVNISGKAVCYLEGDIMLLDLKD